MSLTGHTSGGTADIPPLSSLRPHSETPVIPCRCNRRNLSQSYRKTSIAPVPAARCAAQEPCSVRFRPIPLSVSFRPGLSGQCKRSGIFSVKLPQTYSLRHCFSYITITVFSLAQKPGIVNSPILPGNTVAFDELPAAANRDNEGNNKYYVLN